MSKLETNKNIVYLNYATSSYGNVNANNSATPNSFGTIMKNNVIIKETTILPRKK